MKIVAPASRLEEVKEYIKLGVEEIYLGINSLELDKTKEDKWNSVNERFERGASFTNFEFLKEIKEFNKEHNNPSEISLTLNRSFYNDDQFEMVKHQILETKDYVDNYIVADPSIIKLVQELAPEVGVVLSCISVSLNSESAKFYTNLGVKKIILPRHLSLNEIRNLSSKNPQIKFEVMILNQFCRNVDGFCFRCHIPEKEIFTTTCNVPFEHKVFAIDEEKIDVVDRNISSVLKKFNPFCGICFIKAFDEMGIDSLKIVGRNNSFIRKVNDVKFIQKILSFLNLEEKDFKKKCKETFNQYYKFECKNNCYY